MIKNKKKAKGHSKSLGMSLLFWYILLVLNWNSFLHQGSIFKSLSSRFKLPEMNLSSSTEVASAAVAAIAAGRTAAKRTGTIAASAAE